MIVLLGVSSRPQSRVADRIYRSYANRLRGLYDRDLGLVDMGGLEEKIEALKSCSVVIVVVATGGTRRHIIRVSDLGASMLVLSHPEQNSLPSALHALYILRKLDRRILHIHAPPDLLDVGTIRRLVNAMRNLANLRGKRVVLMGVDGAYLESERYDMDRLAKIFGLNVETVLIDEFLRMFESSEPDRRLLEELRTLHAEGGVEGYLNGAARMYSAVKKMMAGACGGGIRCFPIISKTRITPCVAVAKLLDEGVAFSCEADLASLVTMMFLRAAGCGTPFMANIADIRDNRVVLCHCTVALSLATEARLRRHFETGYGVSVEGTLREGEITLAKISPDFARIFITEGTIVSGKPTSSNMCRTQIVVRLGGVGLTSGLLKGAFAHHLVLTYGAHSRILRPLSEMLGLEVFPRH